MKIYTNNNCPYCKQLIQFCDKNNKEHEIINIEKDFRAKAKLISKGLKGLPVIEIDNELINGNIEELKKRILND
jgi:glutaredoxin-like protein NrdH